MSDFMRSAILLLGLLNPFLVIIYLVDIVEKLDLSNFVRVMFRAGLIAGAVFCCFAIVGDAIFSDLLHAEFASFQIFGGIVFLLVGVQFVFQGPKAIEILRGESEHLAGAIAMPILIGPGTISACVVIGQRHEPLMACGIAVTALAISISAIIAMKAIHDLVRPRNARLVERYIAVAGRVTALYVGTVAVDMIMRGILDWAEKF